MVYLVRVVNIQRKPYSVDHRILLPDGSERFVHEEAEIEYDSQNKAIRMVGTIQDISTRKKNELELKKLSTAIEQSESIIFITNPTGRIEYINR